MIKGELKQKDRAGAPYSAGYLAGARDLALDLCKAENTFLDAETKRKIWGYLDFFTEYAEIYGRAEQKTAPENALKIETRTPCTPEDNQPQFLACEID